MKKEFRNILFLFVLLTAIVAIKTNTEIISFVSLILLIVGAAWLIIDRIFQKKGCEICHNTIAKFKDEDGRRICLSCHNKEVAKQAKTEK